MWKVSFNGKGYNVTDENAERVQRAYQDVHEAEGGMRVGSHQVLMSEVQVAGVPVRTFYDAEKVAAQL